MSKPRNPQVPKIRAAVLDRPRLPDWLKKPVSKFHQGNEIRKILLHEEIHTVCESAQCPNRGECFSKQTVTFMILGDHCTRTCGFCAVTAGKPLPLNQHEPSQVAEAAFKLKLKHVVITSVTRDDLPDGGSKHFAKVILEVRNRLPYATIEVLVPDFKGSSKALQNIFLAKPDVFNHNVETIPDFYSFVRPQANYHQSLQVLKWAKDAGMVQTKSGIMLGFGETESQVLEVLGDLKSNGVDGVTIGQYLSPSQQHLPVKEYVHPDQFKRYETLGKAMGFQYIFSAPLVRSSYRAGEIIQAMGDRQQAMGEIQNPSSSIHSL